jgi:hypothetical protein
MFENIVAPCFWLLHFEVLFSEVSKLLLVPN